MWSNKQIRTCNFLNITRLIEEVLPEKAGLVAHEFLHTLGYQDLYANNQSQPVSSWDIMGQSSMYLAYLRSYFSNWLDIQTITSSQTLVLDSQDKKDGNQAYILKSPANDNEFFFVEFRKKSDWNNNDTLDSKIGCLGIIVYRIDTTVENLINQYGSPGIYIFRPQPGQNGYNSSETVCIQQAFLSEESGRKEIGFTDLNKTLEDGALTFTDGTNSGIKIFNVSNSSSDQMTLDISIPTSSQIDLWQDIQFKNANNDIYDSKNIAIISNDNTLYIVSYENNTISLYQYKNNEWLSWVDNLRRVAIFLI